MLTASDLDQFTGTENWYIHFFRQMVYTDGIKYMAEHAQAYWLIDAVASYQPQINSGKITSKAPDFDLRDFQLWRLQVNTAANGRKSAVLTCRGDTDLPIVVEQHIEFTDFPLDTFEFYVERGEKPTMLLKSEH